MPNLEELAANGVIFGNAFSNAPVCSTARSTLATGVFGPRMGNIAHRAYEKVSLPQGLKPVSQLLGDAGYYTSNRSKEDYNFLKPEGIWDDSSVSAHWRNRKPGQPFYHVQSFQVTHEANMQFPAEDVRTELTQHDPAGLEIPTVLPDTATTRYAHARYLDLHVELDRQLGDVVDQLRADGLWDSTFVFYFGDHGGVLPGSKGYINERGLQIPLIIHIPDRFEHLVAAELRGNRGRTIGGFVNFVDFAPTLLALAGLPAEAEHDGRAFIGPDVDAGELADRDVSFSHANRFGEKFGHQRAVRKGEFKYVRNYFPQQPDSLPNAYRTKQAAYQEWLRLYREGNLTKAQVAFFEPRPAEALYDLANDPWETRNLASEPDYNGVLLDLRRRLREELERLPDLGFYPESWLIHQAFPNAASWGQAHKAEVGQLIRVADTQIRPFDEVSEALRDHVGSSNEWVRYWAWISLSGFGIEAQEFLPIARHTLTNDSNLLVRARALEFLSLASDLDPVHPMLNLVAESDDHMVTLEMLNIAALLRLREGYRFDVPDRPELLEREDTTAMFRDRRAFLSGETD